MMVHHGTLARRYGVQTAIDALAVLENQIRGVRLRVIGEGDYVGELKIRMRVHGLQDRVEFIGWVPYDELVDLLSGADLGLVPFVQDVYTELMLPNKLFEYIGLGLPVVAARTRAVSETFDESCLSYYNPGDGDDCARAILEVHRDPDRARAKAEKARQVYQDNHRWGIMKQRYLDIYARLI
jgi:glycosyltransferase involved in cell wall biosynthesis